MTNGFPGRRVLVVEDDPDIRGLIRDVLEAEQYEVLGASDGKAGLRVLHSDRPDIVILDVMMPELDGWDTLDRIRDMSDVPVLMLTVRTLDWERARGLRSGADDYLTKPFSPMELGARVAALLRRVPSVQSRPAVYEDESLRIDFRARRVTVGAAVVPLTPLEFRMLTVFTTNAGQVLSRDQILELVWKSKDAVFPEQVKLYVGYLRRKLSAAGVEPIHTVRGFGYMYGDRCLSRSAESPASSPEEVATTSP